MIEEFLTNTNPMYLTGMSSGITATTVDQSSATNVEYCATCGCDYVEYAFHTADATELEKNDHTSILVKKSISSETWTFKLEKNGLIVATLNSSTFGTYYDFGSLLYSYYKGMVVDWRKVYNTHGNGKYRIVIEKTLGSATTTAYTHFYQVMPYNTETAESTVKIETYQNGNYVNGAVFRNMNWYQSIRVRGRLHSKKPKLSTEEYLTSDRVREQVVDIITNTYTLELAMLPSNIYNEIIYGRGLSNRMLITDYARFAGEVFRQYPVKMTNIRDLSYYRANKNSSVVLELTDRAEGTIKSY